MKARTATTVSRYAVSCEPERPYNRLQIVLLRFLGLMLGRHIV